MVSTKFFIQAAVLTYICFIKVKKTWIAVWVEREHLPAASWQTAWGLQHED